MFESWVRRASMAEKESIRLAIDVAPPQTEAVNVDFTDFIDFAAYFLNARHYFHPNNDTTVAACLPIANSIPNDFAIKALSGRCNRTTSL
jgi:hypothetical protein